MDNNYIQMQFTHCISEIGRNIFNLCVKNIRNINDNSLKKDTIENVCKLLLSLCVNKYNSVRLLNNQLLMIFIKEFPMIKYEYSCVKALVEIYCAVKDRYNNIMINPHIIYEKVHINSIDNTINIPYKRESVNILLSQIDVIMSIWINECYYYFPERIILLLNKMIILNKNTLNSNIRLGISV